MSQHLPCFFSNKTSSPFPQKLNNFSSALEFYLLYKGTPQSSKRSTYCNDVNAPSNSPNTDLQLLILATITFTSEAFNDLPFSLFHSSIIILISSNYLNVRNLFHLCGRTKYKTICATYFDQIFFFVFISYFSSNAFIIIIK